ncbi:MAG: hypothetical protein GY906_23440 [bacterium]|nr:hypothetical protein [bacterium]
MSNAFQLVKDAIAAHADAILSEYGIKHHREGTKLKGSWTAGFLCPLCGDSSGSASFTHALYLKCHQCATKADVFDWLAKHTGKKPWDIVKELADRLSIDLPKRGKKIARSARAMPLRMTEDILKVAISELWDDKDAEPARELLASRKLDSPSMLAELEVGWIRGWIVFAQRDEGGQLMERFRGWNPGNKAKWMWFGQGTGGPGIWPARPAPEGSRILLLEGESDVLTALVRLRLDEAGWRVCTWTAGATSSPEPKMIPRDFHGREVHIAYDNDVFQGDDYRDYWNETKPGKDPNHARAALEQRLKNLLNKLGPTFMSLGCPVIVRQCPIDPKENFGGDFRDWVDGGGSDLTDWKPYPFEELPAFGKAVADVPFNQVFSELHNGVRTRVQVEAVASDDITLVKTFEMKCEMGQHTCCSQCPGARKFPDRVIDMSDYQRELVVGLASMNVCDYVSKNVIQKPKQCPKLEVVPIDATIGSEWRGAMAGHSEEAAMRSLQVFSEEAPSLSGEVEIEGTVYPNHQGNGVIMLANSVRSLDKTEVDLDTFINDFMQVCPVHANEPELIEDYLNARARDLAFHITRIYGRRDIHVAHDLLMHSTRRADLWGAVQRAWLDICVYGETRTGKSLTFRRLMDYHGLGLHHTSVSNISRAGLVMGADKNGMLKPGLFPRTNGKALMLDEFHFLVQNATRGQADHPMSWLQSPRDEGVASGIKIYGNRDLPAEVRFVVIANWMRNKRRIFEFPCEHVGALYGAPETLARLDFALAIGERPDQVTLDKVEQFWNKERLRTMILRAWAQDATQVLIDDDALQLAKDRCKGWEGLYESEQLPLFTPEEKPASVMRIAIAVANICFSHPKNDPYSVHVRAAHVEWACQWLEKTWRISGYDRYSLARRDSQEVVKPFDAERSLTVTLGLEDPLMAETILSQFMSPFGANEVSFITGKEPFASMKWISRMQALRVFEKQRGANSYHVQYTLTRGGEKLLSNMLHMARNEEEMWFRRYERLKQWASHEKLDIPSMTAEAWEIFDGQDPHDQALPF